MSVYPAPRSQFLSLLFCNRLEMLTLQALMITGSSVTGNISLLDQRQGSVGCEAGTQMFLRQSGPGIAIFLTNT